MIVVGSGIVNTCCCFFSAVVVVVVVTRQCGESSWHASTHCRLHMQPCQPNDCSSKLAVGLNHKRTAKVAVLHSEAHAAATSLPMHSRRNGIAWDLVLHYALHYDMHDASTPLTPTNYSMVQRICSVPLLEPRSSAISDLLVALKGFHASEYVAFLLGRERQSNVDVRPTVSTTTTKRAREEEGSSTIASSHHQHDLLPIPEDATYGFVSECHPFVGMARTALSIAQGTLAAVECIAPPLLEHAAPSWCAIHWWGGRHHAHAERASGFCFLNDVVVGVQQLQQRLRANHHIGRKPRVLVVDIDAHHGDGTQEAFYHDPSVFTLSSHRVGLGVYPGTGFSTECGEGFGRGTTCNVPLPEGCCGSVATPLVVGAIDRAWASFRPDAVVVVCGADALQGDPLGGLNLDVGDMQTIVRHVVQLCMASMGTTSCLAPSAQQIEDVKPLLVLGAGGYVDTSFAKVAAAVTRDILDAASWLEQRINHAATASSGKLPTDPNPTTHLFCSPLLSVRRTTSAVSGVPVPDACQHFGAYGPTFHMEDLPAPLFPRVTSLDRWDPEALLRGGDDASDRFASSEGSSPPPDDEENEGSLEEEEEEEEEEEDEDEEASSGAS